jgi:hypothetical protein
MAEDIDYDTDEYHEDWMDSEPTCSICDGLGHGYPGAGFCPLEQRTTEPDFDGWGRR